MAGTTIISEIGAGRDYTDPISWDADFGGAANQDLVALDTRIIGEMYDSNVGGSTLFISGYTTSLTQNVILRAADGLGYDGTQDPDDPTATVGINVRTGSAGAITVDTENVVIGGYRRGIRIEQRYSSPCLWISGLAHNSVIDGCLIPKSSNADSGSNSGGVSTSDTDTVLLHNLVVWSNQTLGTARGIRSITFNAPGTVFANCQVISKTAPQGYDWSFENYYPNTSLPVNCVGFYGKTVDFKSSASPVTSNNASGDATAPGANPQHNIDIAANYPGLATDDLKPADGAVDLAGNGLAYTGHVQTLVDQYQGQMTDIGPGAGNYYDITGTTRTQWDIGPWLLAAGPPAESENVYSFVA